MVGLEASTLRRVPRGGMATLGARGQMRFFRQKKKFLREEADWPNCEW